MFEDLPPDLERLHTLRVWHAMWLARIDRKIAAIRKRQAEAEHGRRARPRPPEWIVELGIGNGGPPVQVHTGDCHIAGSRRRPVDRDEARRLLASGLPGCTHCRPEHRLHILDLELFTEWESDQRVASGACDRKAPEGPRWGSPARARPSVGEELPGRIGDAAWGPPCSKSSGECVPDAARRRPFREELLRPGPRSVTV